MLLLEGSVLSNVWTLGSGKSTATTSLIVRAVMPSFSRNNKWHYLAVVYDGKQRRLYCDGGLLVTDEPGEFVAPPPLASVISVGNVTVSSVGGVANANNVGTSGAVGTAGNSGAAGKTTSGKGSSSNGGKDRGGGSGSKGSGAGSNGKEKKESMPFVGDVMEVRVWGRALSAEEIISGSN